jgi:hypothetical protein
VCDECIKECSGCDKDCCDDCFGDVKCCQGFCSECHERQCLS